jgi:hypothetical protein
VRALDRRGVNVAFVKPVAQPAQHVLVLLDRISDRVEHLRSLGC